MRHRAALIALLSLVACAPASAQTLARRVADAPDGRVRLSFPARPNVCGYEDAIVVRDEDGGDDHIRTFRGSSDDLDEVIEDFEFRPLTPHTTTSRSELLEELAWVRRSGFAVEREQTYLGMGCVAVPISDDEGRVMAAISASEEVHKLTPQRVETLRSELMRVIPAIKKRILPSHRSGAVSLRGRSQAMRTASLEKADS